LQAYFDRWQIEVNHREEKDSLGVGQAQVRSKAFAVAAHSALHPAALLTFGSGRDQHHEAFPAGEGMPPGPLSSTCSHC
jgi:hypothetical protein